MKSIWMNDYIHKNLDNVKQHLNTPVLIIGGGIAGLTCAYYLMKNKIKFILVDSKKIATGVSAYTTAQISIAHDKLYDDISNKHHEEKAVAYLKDQKEGLNLLKKIIETENINCDYKEESTILCAQLEKNVKVLNNQFDIISKHDKNCQLLSAKNDVFNYEKGLEFKHQFIINPMKYMMGIRDILLNNQVPLYEQSKVTKINKHKNDYEVIINDKHKITTNKIIMACHYPFLNPDNLYFAKLYQSKSYAIAFQTKLKLQANYVSLDEPFYYLRTYDESTLIIGGSDHFTGIDNDIGKCYEVLMSKIYELDKDAKILCKWYTEDCMSIDSLPFVGRYSNKNSNIILVTGFQKWGFTNSHIAAKNVVNILTNKKFKNLYRTDRTTLLRDLKGTFRMAVHSINGLFISKLFVKKDELENIKIDSGKVMKYKNTNVLVYRKNKDEYIFLKNKCAHMGCSLIWNDIDKVWESKCHGSIFDKYGHVIYGPAIKDLERVYF